MPELLATEELPPGFSYPASFVRVAELGLTNLEPWHVIQGPRLRERNEGLARRFPARVLVPFAERQDNDDVACWDVAVGAGVVVVVHDFASPGWEDRGQHVDFHSWLRQAIEDLIDFE